MKTQGLRMWLLAAGFAALLAGCHGIPSAPTGATRPEGATVDRNGYDDSDGDGWLMRRLQGHAATETPEASGSNSTAPKFDPNVRNVSATQILPSPADLNRRKRGVVYLAEDDPEADAAEMLARKKTEEKSSALSWLPPPPDEWMDDIKGMAGYGPDKKIARQAFRDGLKLYEEKQFAKAAAKFKTAASRWPDSSLEEDALFLRGESLFFADNYPDSRDAFNLLLKKYDNTRHLEKVMIREFAIARYWEQLSRQHPSWGLSFNLTDKKRPFFDTMGYARKSYETVTLHDPTGPLADDSLMALANMYFLKERYEEAADYYDRLRKEHPNSKHVVDAHLLLIKSKQSLYQGALYDAAPIKEADEVAEQTLRQFGSRLGEDRDRLIKLRKDIALEMARRDWAMAKFYEKKKQFGAARICYGYILKDYPDMEIAQAAQKRLDEIKDYPAKPANHFKWLTDVFPDKRK